MGLVGFRVQGLGSNCKAAATHLHPLLCEGDTFMKV